MSEYLESLQVCVCVCVLVVAVGLQKKYSDTPIVL